MELLTTRNFNGIQLDCYKADNAEDDFLATREQIGRLLGYKNPRIAITNIHQRNADRLDKFSTVTKLSTVEGSRTVTREVIVYNFEGLLEICRYSNKPKANAVMDFLWSVAKDIRKYGMYLSNRTQEIYKTSPENFKQLLDKYVAEHDKVLSLQAKIDAMTPKAVLGDMVLALPGAICFGEAAKFYRQRGLDIGRNRLIRLCVDLGWLCKQRCQLYKPSQKGIEKGVVNIEVDANGCVRFTDRPMLTSKGVQELYKVLLITQRPIEFLLLKGETEN